MVLIKLAIVIVLIYTIALQCVQFKDQCQDRSLVIEVLYMAIIIALLFTTNFFALI